MIGKKLLQLLNPLKQFINDSIIPTMPTMIAPIVAYKKVHIIIPNTIQNGEVNITAIQNHAAILFHLWYSNIDMPH